MKLLTCRTTISPQRTSSRARWYRIAAMCIYTLASIIGFSGLAHAQQSAVDCFTNGTTSLGQCAQAQTSAVSSDYSADQTAQTRIQLSPKSDISLTSSLAGSVNQDPQFRLPDDFLGTTSDQYRLDAKAGISRDIGNVSLESYGKVSLGNGEAASAQGLPHIAPFSTSADSEQAFSLGANVSSDLNVNGRTVKPFAGVSIESKQQSYNNGELTNTDDRFNLGVGFETEFSDRASAFMSYESSISTDFEDATQGVQAGISLQYR